MEQKLVALLPLKAHSERVPRKNFRKIAGKPLVSWILETLLALDEVSRVVINTDARSILSDIGVIDSERVLIRDRKAELCGDFVSMNSILKDDIASVDADEFLMTHTTNPLLSTKTMRNAVQKFRNLNSDFDSLYSVNRIQTRFYREDGSAVNHDPENLLRTQDLEPWYEENSSLYLFTKDSFCQTKSRIGNKALMFQTPPIESIDIDEPHQWYIAEAVLEKQQREIKV